MFGPRARASPSPGYRPRGVGPRGRSAIIRARSTPRKFGRYCCHHGVAGLHRPRTLAIPGRPLVFEEAAHAGINAARPWAGRPRYRKKPGGPRLNGSAPMNPSTAQATVLS